MSHPVSPHQLDFMLAKIRLIAPLSPEREFELAVRYVETRDGDAAHELVVSHLPFVVKIAFQYRHYMIPVEDLIQEGTMGLMRAVQRFDPFKGYRLVSFAVWWVKAYIKNLILRSWNLVKLGTTQAERKLFFRMGNIGAHLDEAEKAGRVADLAAHLHVKPDDVIEMEARVRAREWSLHDTVGQESGTAMDVLEDESANQETLLMDRQADEQDSRRTKTALQKLDARERFIVRKRFMDDTPWTLQKLGDHFGTSRERIRQLEKRALSKLRNELSDYYPPQKEQPHTAY